MLRRGTLSVLIAASFTPFFAHATAAAIDPVATSPAAPLTFDADFFPSGTAPQLDLSRFEKDNAAIPGDYHGDIIVNSMWRARSDIAVALAPGTDEAYPCFDANMLSQYGVNLKAVAADTTHPDRKPIPEGRFCGPLSSYIPGASADFDMGDQRLSLSIPQIYVARNAQGYVDPSQWDAGIHAAVIGYNANLYRSAGQTNGYLGLNTSMNFGSWHAVHQGAATWDEHGGIRYQSSATYLQHDVPSWRAQIIAGDTFTSGDLFDSVRVRGLRLYTDDRMLPQSLRGYAPVVHGTADTNAHVIIRQNGYIIYDANVAPGPFSIDDLYPTGYGGDLDVEVNEADGRVRRFVVPFSTVPLALRPGQHRWSLTAGKVQQINLVDSPKILQATYQHGLNNLLTAYAGVTLATGYRSALAGVALNTSMGAFSSDVTQARNDAPGLPATQGWSMRLGYNKNITETGTNFALATYRYSTGGYVGLSDATYMRDAVARGIDPSAISRTRNRMDVNISQNLGANRGQLYAIASARNYWNGGRQVDFSLGYSNHWRSLSYSLSAQRSTDNLDRYNLARDPSAARVPGAYNGSLPPRFGTRRDTRLFLTLTLPLGDSGKAPMLTALANRSNQEGNSQQVSLNGHLDDENRYNYGATLGRADGNISVALNGQYNGGFGNVSAGYSQGSGFTQLGAGISGSVVVHRNGAVFSPPTGDTIGLVYAPGARGARINMGQGAVVDVNGYGVVPYLQPYMLNDVEIDPKNADPGLEFKSTKDSVAPRAGSVVLLKYETHNGRVAFIDVERSDGNSIPFGADVIDNLGNSVGVVGQAGRLIVKGVPSQGQLTVRWGDDAADSCTVDYQLSANNGGVIVPSRARCVSVPTHPTYSERSEP